MTTRRTPTQTIDIFDIPLTDDVTDEIALALLELKDAYDLDTEEVREAVPTFPQSRTRRVLGNLLRKTFYSEDT